MNEYVKWRKCDLHLHSDASIGDSNMTVESIVDKAVEQGLELIALTDHNNVANMDKFIVYAKSRGIGALPGVELKTDMGRPAVHLIVLFPESFTQKYISENFLFPLGLTEENICQIGKIALNSKGTREEFYKRGLLEKAVNFRDAANQAHGLGGIVVAHAGRKDGSFEKIPHAPGGAGDVELWGALGAEKKSLMIECVDVCELHMFKQDQIDFYLTEFNTPTIICSDAHKIEDVGSRYTSIKMDTIDFNGLKQIIYEPRTRIKHGDITTGNHYYIKNIIVDEGYYKDLDIELSPDLNTIIGGNSSGKSVFVDYIRFCTGNYPDEKNRSEFYERIYNLLKTGSKVTLKIAKRDGGECIMERILSMTRKGVESQPEDTSAPPLFIPSAAGFDDFHIEAYSQGELIQIIKKKDQLLKILDGLGDYKELILYFEEIEEILRLNADKLCALGLSIEQHAEAIHHKNDLVVKIRETKGKVTNPLINEFQKWHYEKTLLDVFEDNIKKVRNESNSFFNTIEAILSFEYDESKIINVSFIEALNKFNAEMKLIISGARDSFDLKLDSLPADITKMVSDVGWEGAYKTKEDEYKTYLKEQSIENIQIDIDNIKSWETEIIAIDKDNVPKFNSIQKRLKNLLSARSSLLHEFTALRHELNNARRSNALALQGKIPQIEFSVGEIDYSVFYEYCKNELSGLGIKKFEEQIDRLSTCKLKPEELVEFVKSKNISGFVKRANITDNTASIIVNHLTKEISPLNGSFLKAYFHLETIACEPHIKLHVIQGNPGIKINFNKLSPGKKCSYLLSILLSSNNCPVIIDQPEDNLDSEFIQAIIDSMKANKGNRQFIIVTHNQNITVLGDSEKIIKVEKDESSQAIIQGRISSAGGVERSSVRNGILSLEGGPEAFRKRAMKYGLYLSSYQESEDATR